jgi:hypothetical protein
MENFFRRLEAYIGVPQTPNMADIIVKVMVEALLILSIATKELNQNSASEFIPEDRLDLLDLSFSRDFSEEAGGKD